MVCPAISSYRFGATALIFCRMFMHIMEVCMSTGFWWPGGGIICVLQTHFIFSSPGHRPCELLSWVSICRPSVSFSHLNLLLWNRWTDFNQTCQKCLLVGPLLDLCFWCWRNDGSRAVHTLKVSSCIFCKIHC
jgi:hypothetical protein